MIVLHRELLDILGKKYTSAILVEHSFYNNRGFSVKFTTDQRKYSEAFAGSGEMSVVKLVHQVSRANKASLILLDEPEVSLHPGAQNKLLTYLLNECINNKHQIVLCTHSPAIVENLPRSAIKVFSQNDNGDFNIIENVIPEQAFKYIGHTTTKKIRILVEDIAAQLLLTKIIKLRNDKTEEIIQIDYHPGGAKDLFKEALIFSRNEMKNTYIYFDGDQKGNEIPENIEIANLQLDYLLRYSTGIKPKEYSFSSDANNQEQIIKEKRKFLKYIKSNCFYFPGKDPEDTMWEASTLTDTLTEYDQKLYKDRIQAWIESQIDPVDVTSHDFVYLQKRLLNNLDTEHTNIKQINLMITSIIDKL